MKKVLLLTLAFGIILMNICGYAAEDKTLYSQDFSTYTGGRFEALNEALENGTWTAMPSDKFLEKDVDGGNTFLKLVNDSDSTSINMTFKFKEKISSGIVVFKYDIAHSGKANTVPRVRLHDEGNTERLVLFINADSSVKKLCGPKPDFKSNVSFSGTNVEYKDITPGIPVSVMQVLNFDEDYFETYVNGAFLDRVEELPFDNIISWGLFGYNTVTYFDNLSIKVLGDVSISASVSGTEGGGNAVDITVPDSVIPENISAKDITVTDKNGNDVAIKSVSADDSKVTATFTKKLEYDEKYKLKLNIKDMYGRSFDEVTFMSKSEVDENGKTVLRVKSVKAVTADGNEVEISSNSTPLITQLKVEFNTFVSSCDNGITLNDKTLDGSIEDKTVTLETGGVLVGGTDYTLKVNENVKSADGTGAKSYEQTFKTTEGGLNVVAFDWYTEDGAEAVAADLSEGTKLRLVLKSANTTKKDESIFLAYSAFSGNAQKAFMFLPIPMKSGEYKTTELEYVVNGVNDVVGTVFDNFLSFIPLSDYATVR